MPKTPLSSLPQRSWGRRSCRLPRLLVLGPLFSALAQAAVTGTVINRTTGQPQPGATVGLNRLGQNGIELIDQAKTDSQGRFSIDQTPQGPHLIRTAWDGVTYNHMLPPGSPTTGLTLEVFNASKQPGAAKVTRHMILFQPSNGEMSVDETFIYKNDGTTAWNDPDDGTLRFFLPAGANGKVQVNATAPGGMPIPAAVNKARTPDVYSVDFAIKPGETRFDLTFVLPYAEGAPYQGKIVTKDENTYLIAPKGITLEGKQLNNLGQEPRTQAHLFGLQGTSYTITLTGNVAPSPAGGDQSESGPQIEQIMPRVNRKVKTILAVSFGILALGFALLYRASAKPGQAVSPARTGKK